MTSSINLNRSFLIFGIPLLLLGGLIVLMQSSLLIEREALSIGITADLLLTVPIVYFLLIRKTKIPKTTVVPVMILGLVIGYAFLPTQNQTYLNLFKTWVLPIIELSVVSFVIYKVSKTVKKFKQNKTASLDFFSVLKNTCYEILPKGVVMPLVLEISVFYYGFVNWKKRELQENEFTYHKESGTLALLIAVLFMIVVETFALHLLIAQWSNIAALIVSLLSVYSGFQIFGFARSMTKRPISIENNTLFLRYGIMSETTINIKDIENIELSSKELEDDDEVRTLSILGKLEAHNVVISLEKEREWFGLYGMKKSYKTLALHVDDPKGFVAKIENWIPED